MNILLILSLLIGVPYGYTQYSISKIEKTHPPAGQFRIIDNIKMHYQISGSGPTVILLHAQPSNQEQFNKLKDVLKNNYTVISIDRPGMGYSESISEQSPKRLMQQARLIRGLVREITNEKPIVVGHSYGGALALSYVVQFEQEVRGLIVVNTASHPWKKGKPWLPFRIISNPIYGKLFTNTFAMMYGQTTISSSADSNFPNGQTPDNYISDTSATLTLRPKTLQSYANDALNLREALALQQDFYTKLTLPVTIMSGDEDSVTPNKIHSYKLHNDILHSKLIKVSGVAHSIPELKPSLIKIEIEKLLKGK
jgi:pimeloyl-ACP methyl ester carboxylesterase